MKKWKIIAELCATCADGFHRHEVLDGNLKRICYAPNIGYRNWIFSYKKVLVSLFDEGNGHYSFYSTVSWLDVAHALLIDRFPRLFKMY